MSKRLIILVLFLTFFLTTGASCIKFSKQGQGVKGMFRSDNKGESWKAIAAYPTIQGVKSLSGLNIYAVHRDPSDQNAFYAATRGQGLYYSYDSGASWDSVPAMNARFIYSVAIDPKDKCTIFTTDGRDIFKTIDCMRTWKTVFTEERPSQRLVELAVDSGDSNVIYGAQMNGDILRSKDKGVSWRVVKRLGGSIRNLVADPFTPKRIYAASYKDGLFRSDDGGEKWINLNNDFKNYNDSKTYYRLILNPGKKDSLFWISRYGILRSDNAGKNWKDMKLLTPPGSVNIYSFAINPKNQSEVYYTGTVLNDKNENIRSTFYKSSDGGKNWVTKKLPATTIPVYMSVHPSNGNTLFLGFTTL